MMQVSKGIPWHTGALSHSSPESLLNLSSDRHRLRSDIIRISEYLRNTQVVYVAGVHVDAFGNKS